MLLHQIGIFQQGNNLSPISERDLIKPLLLGITDVGSDNLFEWQRLMSHIGKDLDILVGLDRELASDSIVNSLNRGVDGIKSKRWFER